ncbi:hypothetical protein V8C43DRAFT_286838 [Trichoderma afarasin]
MFYYFLFFLRPVFLLAQWAVFQSFVSSDSWTVGQLGGINGGLRQWHNRLAESPAGVHSHPVQRARFLSVPKRYIRTTAIQSAPLPSADSGPRGENFGRKDRWPFCYNLDYYATLMRGRAKPNGKNSFSSYCTSKDHGFK